MFSGRHLILLGVIACAGLLSVRDGQRQVQFGYQIGSMEKQLRDIRSEIELARIRHQALQSPKSVSEKTTELKLPLAPQTPATVVIAPPAPPKETSHSLGSPQGARPPAARPPAPARNAPTPMNTVRKPRS